MIRQFCIHTTCLITECKQHFVNRKIKKKKKHHTWKHDTTRNIIAKDYNVGCLKL